MKKYRVELVSDLVSCESVYIECRELEKINHNEILVNDVFVWQLPESCLMSFAEVEDV